MSQPASQRTQPESVGRPALALPHVDGLDGLRGLAIAAVVLFHGGIAWASGGFLGVELFFVLSGFLITSLLVREWLDSGSVGLGNFWGRRARRLLPALFVVVIVIGIYSAIKGTFDAVPGLFGDGLATLFYYANWHEIAVGSSYFVTSGPTSPFQQTWSLAIEEQFYVVWPLVVLGIAFLITRRRSSTTAKAPSEPTAHRWLEVMLGLSVVMILGSALDAAALFHHGAGLNRVYYGTDTRASGLLSGAALAFLIARLRMFRQPPSTPRALSPLVSLVSGLAIAGICVLMWRVNGADNWLYPLGFLLTDALSVLLIAVIITSPRAIAGRVFSLAPLRWLGQISYGLYLWHFPLFLWITASGALAGWKLFVVRVLAALVVATASYVLIEQPIRQRRWPGWLLGSLAPVAMGAGLVALAIAASVGATPSPTVIAHQRVNLKGTGDCRVALANTRLTGEVAPPKSQESAFAGTALTHRTVTWPAPDTTVKTFYTCPPKRALVVGDSIAFTIAEPYLYNEQDYGMAISDAAILGCAFGVRGELDVNGMWEAPPSGCPDELRIWAREASAFKASEVIVQLGYRDEFNWRWNGRIEHLGEPGYDAYVESRIRDFIDVLGEDGKRKLLFLSIPFVEPKQNPDGSEAPQTLPLRHAEINDLIRQAARTDGANASVLDIDTVLSPGDHYDTDVNGELCRADGIHVTPYCATLLEPDILDAARTLLAR